MDRHGHDERRHAALGFGERRAFHRAGPGAADARVRVAPERPRTAANAPAARRIWDVDPDALKLVIGVLLTRPELEACFARFGDAVEGAREDALQTKAVVRCTTPCVFAERVEAALSQRSAALLPVSRACPMAELAARWIETRDALPGPEAAAFLWHLASDARPHLEPLAAAVQGDLTSRALRLLREDRPTP